ncbi:hypothetical protein [Ruegeria atlantica]|uniref:phosphotriesterase family protein n=1 Tax=Ruegeria atlantica TaxID=81569 RepID=UPI00147E2521|nr:hypothetical protein [Ruegeria atlantica]
MSSYQKTRREFLEMAAGVGAVALAAGAIPVRAASDPGAGTVMTVLGSIPARDLGSTLMHEHIYSDFSGYFEETQPLFSKVDKEKFTVPDPEDPVRMEDLAYLNMGGFVFSRDAWSLRDRNLMLRELEAYKRAGGQSILEVSPWGKAQGSEYHEVLRGISENSGINIVCSTGLYGGDQLFWHDVALGMSEAELTKTFIGHCVYGFGHSGVRAGHHKTAPNSWNENEKRAARASIAAQRETGYCYTIHHGAKCDQTLAEQMHADLLSWDCQPERTVFAHIQRYIVNYDLRRLVTNPEGRISVDLDFYKKILDHGFILSFDTFSTNMGSELFEFLLDDGRPNAFEGEAGDNDAEMLAMIYFLIQEGYSKQIVLSQDCYSKIHLRSYGGHGFTRVNNYALPLLRNVGVSEDALTDMVVNNPARLLSTG